MLRFCCISQCVNGNTKISILFEFYPPGLRISVESKRVTLSPLQSQTISSKSFNKSFKSPFVGLCNHPINRVWVVLIRLEEFKILRCNQFTLEKKMVRSLEVFPGGDSEEKLVRCSSPPDSLKILSHFPQCLSLHIKCQAREEDL